MFNITDGKNNVSRDKPVEHIDMVIGLHVSACTSCTRTMRARRDIAIDITESVQRLPCTSCAKVYPGAAGLAQLHYGGYSKVRGRLRLQRPHQSAPKC